MSTFQNESEELKSNLKNSNETPTSSYPKSKDTLTSSERSKQIELQFMKDRSQTIYNKLTCIHELTEYHRGLLIQEMTGLDEQLSTEEPV
jgi:transposase-like protein